MSCSNSCQHRLLFNNTCLLSTLTVAATLVLLKLICVCAFSKFLASRLYPWQFCVDLCGKRPAALLPPLLLYLSHITSQESPFVSWLSMLTNTMHQKHFFGSTEDDYEDRTQYNINISFSSVNSSCLSSSRPSSAISTSSSSSSSSFFSRTSKQHRKSNFSISSILTNSPKLSFHPSHNLHNSSSSSILTINSSSSSSSSVEATPSSSYSTITPSPAADAYPTFRNVANDFDTQQFGHTVNNTTITHIQFNDPTASNHTATAAPPVKHPRRPTKRINRPISNNSNYYTNISNMVCLFWFNDSNILETAFQYGKNVDFAAKNSKQMAQITDLDFSRLTIPSASFKQFIMNVIKYTQLPATAVSLALYYILRLKRLSVRPIVGNANSEYRVFSIALMLANKFLDDNTFTNKTWAEVTHLPLKEITAMEIEFLGNMDYNLNVDPEDWALWQSRLKVWLNIHSTVQQHQQQQQQQFTITNTFDPIELHTNKRLNRKDHLEGPNLKKVALSPVIHQQDYHYLQPSLPQHQHQPQLHQHLNRLSYSSQFTMINGDSVLPPPLVSAHPPPFYYFQKNKHFEGIPQGPLVLPGVDTLTGHMGSVLPALVQNSSRDGVDSAFSGSNGGARPPRPPDGASASVHARTGDVGFSFM